MNFRCASRCLLRCCPKAVGLWLGGCLVLSLWGPGAQAQDVAVEAAASPALAASAPASAASVPTPAAPPVVPVYRNDVPAPLTLHYLLRRSWLSGNGELRWRRTGETYELSLQGSVAGLQVLQQTSTGQVDATGLSPLRFTDQRARGAAQSAQFERERERQAITFTGQPEEAAWAPGVQDRLSWMMQLPAVVRADPTLHTAGRTVELYVVGARGETDVWTFRFVGSEDARTPMGNVAAGKWVREPRKPRDTSVEIWLAPSLGHLPARARLSSGSDSETLELLLQRSTHP